MRVRTAAVFAAGPVATGLLSVGVIPIMAHSLSPEDVGHYYLFQTIAALSSVVLTIGMDQAYVREYHELPSKTYAWMCAVWAPICLIIAVGMPLIAFREALAELLLGVHSSAYGWSLVLCILLAAVVRLVQVRLRMEQRAWAFSIGNLLPKLCVAIILVAGIELARTDALTYLAVAGAHVAGLGLALALASGAGAVRVRRVATDDLLQDTKRLFKYGYPLAVTSILSWILLSSPAWFVRALSSIDELALLSITMGIAGIATLVQAIFGTIWAPVAYSWLHDPDLALMKIRAVGRLVSISIMLVLCLISLAAVPVAALLPSAYASVWSMLPAAALPGLMTTVAEVSGIGINVARRSWWLLGTAVVAAGFNWLVCLALVPGRGAGGAVMALGFSFLLFAGLRGLASTRLWHSILPAGHQLTLAGLGCMAIVQAGLRPDAWGVWITLWSAAFLAVILMFRTDIGEGIRAAKNGRRIVHA